MAEKQEVEEEMSMDEILSSIRKYVIDENGPAIAAATTAPQMSKQLSGAMSSPRTAPESRLSDQVRGQKTDDRSSGLTREQMTDEDVIELINPLDEGATESGRASSLGPLTSSPVSSSGPSSARITPILTATPAVTPTSSPPNVAASPLRTQPEGNKPHGTEQPARIQRPQYTPFQTDKYPFYPPTEDSIQEPGMMSSLRSSLESRLLDQVRGQRAETKPLVSPQTAADTANAFSRLALAAQQQTRKPGMGQGMPQGMTGGTTVEQLVTEVTKSMIKTWLDQNLAPIVEAMVTKEIERITSHRG